MQRTKVIVTILDDLDLRGGLETEATEHHKLALDGHEVEIDLTAEHSKVLTEFLAPHMLAGHTIKYPAKTRRPTSDLGARMSEARKLNDAARAWATVVGRAIPNRGTNAHAQLVEDYQAARSRGDTA